MAGGVWGGHGNRGASGRLPCHLWYQRPQEVSFLVSRLTPIYVKLITSITVRHGCVSCVLVGNLQRQRLWRIRMIQPLMDKLTKPLMTVTMNKLDSEPTEEQREGVLIKHQITAKYVCVKVFGSQVIF